MLKRLGPICVLAAIVCLILAGAAADAQKCVKGYGKVHGTHPAKPLAKNIIIIVSDGCGYNQVDAASMYQYGKTGVQCYEKFPVRVAMSHYMHGAEYDPLEAWATFDYVKSGATDSAAAATTMSTGEKTYSGAVGVDANKKPLVHFMAEAEKLGKATGVVSSVEFSHATPAAFVAHNESRGNYADIANEMIYSSATDVIMGCGAPDYDNSGVKVTTLLNPKYVGGATTWADIQDGTVLGADANGDSKPDEWTVIRSRQEFQNLLIGKGKIPTRVLGIPYVYQTLQNNRAGTSKVPYDVPLTATVPTLAEMTAAALRVLEQDKDGFCLMIEAGAVDWAGHGNNSARVIEEQIDSNRSVEVVMEWVKAKSNWGETVVIVTGDHETGYLTGPGSGQTQNGPVWMPLVNNGKGKLPGMQWNSGSHTNQLIPFYAKGRAARLFHWAATEYDPIRGLYLDNTSIGDLAFRILGVKNPNK